MMEDQQKSQVPQDFSSSSCCYLRDSPLLSFSYVHEYASCCSLHHRLIVDQMVDRCQTKPSQCCWAKQVLEAFFLIGWLSYKWPNTAETIYNSNNNIPPPPVHLLLLFTFSQQTRKKVKILLRLCTRFHLLFGVFIIVVPQPPPPPIGWLMRRSRAIGAGRVASCRVAHANRLMTWFSGEKKRDLIIITWWCRCVVLFPLPGPGIFTFCWTRHSQLVHDVRERERERERQSWPN